MFGQPLGAVMLFAFVVPKLVLAAQSWAQITGIRRWYVVDPFVTEGLRFRGARADGAFSVALAASGSVIFSLVMPKDDHPSPYREAIARRGWNSLTHFGISTRQFDTDVMRLA